MVRIYALFSQYPSAQDKLYVNKYVNLFTSIIYCFSEFLLVLLPRLAEILMQQHKSSFKMYLKFSPI